MGDVKSPASTMQRNLATCQFIFTCTINKVAPTASSAIEIKLSIERLVLNAKRIMAYLLSVYIAPSMAKHSLAIYWAQVLIPWD
jgi:hypothetical protein